MMRGKREDPAKHNTSRVLPRPDGPFKSKNLFATAFTLPYAARICGDSTRRRTHERTLELTPGQSCSNVIQG